MGGNRRGGENMNDAECRKFLKALDEAAVDVSDWEAGFISSTLDQKTFSEKQRVVIEKMMLKYGNGVKW